MRGDDRALETAYAKNDPNDTQVMPKTHKPVFNSPDMYLDGAAGGGFHSAIGGPRNLVSSGAAYAVSGGRTSTSLGARRLSQARSQSAIDEAALWGTFERLKSPQHSRAGASNQRNASNAVHDILHQVDLEQPILEDVVEERLARRPAVAFSGKVTSQRTDKATK